MPLKTPPTPPRFFLCFPRYPLPHYSVRRVYRQLNSPSIVHQAANHQPEHISGWIQRCRQFYSRRRCCIRELTSTEPLFARWDLNSGQLAIPPPLRLALESSSPSIETFFELSTPPPTSIRPLTLLVQDQSPITAPANSSSLIPLTC